MKLGKALTWDEIADIFGSRGSRPARTLPMQLVFDRVAARPDIYLHPFDGTLHRILEEAKSSDETENEEEE